MATQHSDGAVSAYPNLKPFVKGDPRINKGGLDQKTRRARKALAKLDDKALALLERLLDEGDPEGLKFWGKYRLPVPTEKTAVDVNVKGGSAAISPALAAKLAAMDPEKH